MRLKQIRRIYYACGTPSWGLHMPLGPHTAAGAGAAIAGECDESIYKKSNSGMADID